MKPAALVTVCEVATLPAALDLAATFADHHAGARVEVVVADATTLPSVDRPDGVGLATGAEVAGDAHPVLLTAYGPGTLAAALVPFALRRAGVPSVALAPDAIVLAPIDLPEDEGALLAASTGDEEVGVCDDGFVALVGEAGVAALDWWAAEAAAARASDRPLEALAARREELVVVHRDGWAVAPWNAASRDLRRGDDGGVLAGDVPVAWARVPQVADAAASTDAAPSAVLAQLDAERAERVQRRSRPSVVADRSAGRLLDGTPLTPRLRRLFRRALDEGGVDAPPTDEASFRSFLRWLQEPDPDHRAAGTSRLLFDVWQQRTDLHAAYGDLRDPDQREGFAGWAVVYGRDEGELPAWIVDDDRAERYGRIAEERARTEAPDAPPPFGVNVAGYLQSALGIGTVARSLVGALDAAHVPVLPVQPVQQPPTRRVEAFEATVPQAVSFPFNLVCVNADGLPAFAHEAGAAFFDGRHTIGYWWWELPELPDELHAAFAHVQEVWVGSRFVRDALERVSPVPVVQMPVPVPVTDPPQRTRAELGLPDGFLALAFLDFNSVMARKNPLGAVEAFRRAFPDAGHGAHLVIKQLNGHLHPRALQELTLAARRVPGVEVLDRYVPRPDLDAMVAAADVFVSLHRSEGFGLPLAEAMALGTPVVATGWSGSADFVDQETGWPVPYELVPVGPGNAPYSPDSLWAEPDLDVAAELLRAVREHPEEAAAKARRGAARIRERYSPAVAGSAMRDRLASLYPRVVDGLRRPRATATLATATPDLDALREGREPPSRPFQSDRRADPGRVAARRLVTPAVRYHDNVDAQIVAYVDALADELERTREEHAALTAATLKGHRRLDGRAEFLATRAGEVDARLARLEAMIVDVGQGLERVHHRFDALAENLAPVVDGARARPWHVEGSFGFRDDPRLGRVLAWTGDDEALGYAGFEAVFRGPRARVDDLLKHYVTLLDGHGPVLDVGAGRGELVALLAAAGIEATGVDSDASMVQEAIDAGLPVAVGDGIAALEAWEPGTLGAVTAMHVVEHLPYDALLAFLSAARRALRPGGVLMAETINPHMPAALKTFWTDPTHRHPLLPETMIVLARAAGFEGAVVTHPRGVGDAETDLLRSDAYTLVATAEARGL